MAHDIFISYSSKDKQTADAICHVLEANKLKCWIAPRNIIAGKNYAEQIMYGLKNAKIVVLVFSKNSQESVFVNNEIDNAFSNNKPIISFKIDETLPEDKMGFFLKNKHWLDAYPNPESVFETLVRDAYLLCEEEREDDYVPPVDETENFDTDESKDLGVKLNTINERVVDVVGFDEDPNEPVEPVVESVESSAESVEPVVESVESSAESVEPVVESVESSAESVEPVVESVESSVEPVEPVEDSKEEKEENVFDNVTKSDENSEQISHRRPPKEDSKPPEPGVFSQYKVPIIIAVAIILMAVVGVVVLSGSGSVGTGDSSVVNVEIDYVDMDDDRKASYSTDFAYIVYGSVTNKESASDDYVVHIDFLDDSGKVVKSNDTKLKDIKDNILGAAFVDKANISKVTVELRDSSGNAISVAESNDIRE